MHKHMDKHRASIEKNGLYKTKNRFAEDDCEFFFIWDQIFLMKNNLHGLWEHFYHIFQIGKSLLNQELMIHTLKLIKQQWYFMADSLNLIKHLSKR